MMTIQINGFQQPIAKAVFLMTPNERKELYTALIPHARAAAKSGPSTRQEVSAEFGRLSAPDKLAFIQEIRNGVATAEAAIVGAQFDDALQAEIRSRKGGR